MATIKVKELLKRLKDDGWFIVAIKGSHRRFKHNVKLGRVTIAGKPNEDLARGTVNSIFKQAQLKEEI